MAIGVARFLGYELQENFDHPYVSRSITEFWRRWHISLSSWLRDYLYIPLGGNRRGPRRTYVNLLLTMLLGGLWHGAAWTFVVWGAIHGGALALDKFLGPLRDRHLRDVPAAVRGWAGWAVTLLVVNIAWVFFRAPDFDTARIVLERLFTAPDGVRWLHPFSLFALLLMGAAQALQPAGLGRWRELPDRRFSTPVVLGLMWWLVLVFPARGFTPFIYFQF
jgi:alginate O-acetyltransferase complex protein AlgI